jgi:hypothetical protein
MNERPVLSRADLEVFDAQPQGSGSEKRFRCPFCQNSERAFHVNLDTGAFNCKRSSCGARGQLSDFWRNESTIAPKSLRERTRIALTQAFGGSLGATSNLAAPIAQEAPQSAKSGNWRELWDASLPILNERAQRGAQYLGGRGISVEVAQAAGVRFCENWAPSADGKTYRAGAAVLYPSIDESGDVVAVGGRYLEPQRTRDGETVKARTGGAARGGVFLAPAKIGGAWWQPFDRRLEAVIIVEGQADALSLAECGFPSVAAGGVNLAPWLHRRAGLRRVFVASDGDAGGDTAAPLWTDYLSGYGAKCERLPPDGAKDWNELLLSMGRDALADWLQARHLPS